MTEDDPDIGGPEGGKTRSHMHFQVLPKWSAPTPTKFELTEREIAIAEIAAFKTAKILRAVIIALTIAGVIVAIGATAGIYVVHQESVRAIAADRDGCRRKNVIRENQARLLRDDLVANERILKGKLNGLEQFRPQIVAGQDRRRAALKRLRQSVRDYPVKGRPYAVDCKAAYP